MHLYIQIDFLYSVIGELDFLHKAEYPYACKINFVKTKHKIKQNNKRTYFLNNFLEQRL